MGKNTVTEAHGEGIRIYGACLKEGSCLSKDMWIGRSCLREKQSWRRGQMRRSEIER